MDCLQAREIVSEAFDRGVTAVSGAAEAREHCRTCSDCRAFVEGLSILRKTPAPAAPADLVDGIVERGRKMAAAGVPRPYVVTPAPLERPGEPGEEATAEPFVATTPSTAVPTKPEERGKWWWVPRAVAGAGAAAGIVAALAMSFQGFRALRGGETGNGVTAVAPTAGSGANSPLGAPAGVPSARSGAPEASADSLTPGAASTQSGGPRYISLGERAYAYLGTRVPDQPSIEVLSQRVTTALDTTGLPAGFPVWQSKTDPEIVFLPTDETSSTYDAFRRVSRTRGGKTYVLYAAPELDRFGLWPALPSRFATPEAGDGSPTFITAGKDDSGLEVFTPPGSTADEGFAVAPGTFSSDAAGADPYWTWWVPK